MDVLCFHDLSEVAAWEPELRRISHASRRKDPFSTFGFIQNVARHPDWYPGDQHVQPWFLIAREGGRAVGYLPLRRVVSTVLGCEVGKLEFFVSHDNDCPQLVALPEREREVSAAFHRYLLSRGDEWGLLEFHQQDPGSQLSPPPKDVDLGRYYARTIPTRENNTVPLRWDSLEAYFESLASKHRADVRRKARRLLSAGNARWLSSDDPKATPALFDLLRTIEAHSWKAEHAIALDSHPDRLAFFRGLLEPLQPMRIRISVLLLDEVPIAGSICGTYAGNHYGLVVFFDDRAQDLSPGAFVQLMMVRTAIEGRCGELNLLSSFAYYKAHWLAEQLPTASGQLFRIGKPWFWKAVLGDFKRRVMPPPPVAAAAFNPDRRGATEAKDLSPRPALKPTPAERAHLDGLLAQLESLPIEQLSGEALAAAIPFGSKQPAKGATAPRAAPTTGASLVLVAGNS